MDRRRFLKTVGVSAGVAGMAVGASDVIGTDHEVVAAAEVPESGVELLTDEFGRSHVYGDDLYGLGYGQGYAQARDRLFQMDLLRLIGRGESAAAIGPSQLPSDVEVKRDLYSEAELEAQWEAAGEDTREMIRGFCAGVNGQMKRRNERGELPGEFTMLGRSLDPWDPIDTVAVIAYTIGFFGVGGGSELGNARTLEAMFDRVAGEGVTGGESGSNDADADTPDTFPDRAGAWRAYGDVNSVVVPDGHYGSLLESEVAATDERALAYDEVPETQRRAIEAARDTEPWGVSESDFDGLTDVFRVAIGALAGASFGSNAIVVDGEHTATGEPMLGGGPQMSLLKPPVIHEIGLHGMGMDVVGVGVVGTPSVVIGRTSEFAWTVTTARDDMVDTIAIDLDPEDHSRYEWDGEFHEFVTEEYDHEANLWAGLIEGQLSPKTVEQEVAYVEQEGTRMPVVAYNEAASVAFVKRVAARMRELEGAFMWADIGRASTRAEFEESLAEFPFGFNFHYVDEDGIAAYRTGSFPDRNGGGDPRFPVPESLHEWTDIDVGWETGASQVDPERGYVVNWNNGPAPGWRCPDGEFDWGGVHRVDVMDRLTREAILRTSPGVALDGEDADIPLEEYSDPLPATLAGKLSLADVEAIVEDCSVQEPFAPRIVPHLVAAARESADEQLHAMADELEAWAGATDLERFRGQGFDRWLETTYSFRASEDGTYPDGGMAIFETVWAKLHDLQFRDTLGEAAPDLEFDPTAGDPLSGAVDPHAGDHGATANKAIVLVETLEGRAQFPWLTHGADRYLTSPDRGAGPAGDVASQADLLRAVMRAAATTLAEEYGSDDPADWRLANRESQFAPLGGAASDTIPMSNRASYQQSIAMGQGDGHEDHLAKSVLPPSNTGHLGTWELIATLFGNEPDRLTSQLDRYANFEYTPHPLDREAVEKRASERTTLE